MLLTKLPLKLSKPVFHAPIQLLVGLALLTNSSIALGDGIKTTITKDKANAWSVTYETSKPVSKIAFRRNPNDARLKRWQPQDDKFELIYENKAEFIVRKDRQLFTETSFSLTPSYTHLTADYAPFSPYSNGGTLFHSGRFFACEELCGDQLNAWEIEFKAPEDEHIILDGQTIKSPASWVDSNSGKSVYVGKQKPKESNGFLTVIDEGLPGTIRDSLNTDIPKLTAYFESKLGTLSNQVKPTLFASYANKKGTSVQGGVLPNCSGQVILAADLEEFQKSSSALFGVNPPLC